MGENDTRQQLDREQVKVQYLSMVSGIISRMTSYSITLKASCVALLAGMYVFLTSTLPGDGAPNPVALIPLGVVTLAFGVLDAKYLQQERCYRRLYGEMLECVDDGYDKSMKMPSPKTTEGAELWRCFFSWSVHCIYFVILAMTVLLFVLCGMPA